MVFLIQNTQNRESSALHAKLDELIRAVEEAQDRYIGLERRSEAEIEDLRADCEGAEHMPTSTGSKHVATGLLSG